MQHEWPLVGRAEERRVLLDVLVGPRRHGLVIGGSAGETPDPLDLRSWQPPT